MVRPTLPAVSVAPITATLRGAKNTFRGELFCNTALREDFVGLMACILFYLCPGVKCGPIQPLHHVPGVQSVLPRNGFDVAIVAGGPESELLKHFYRGGMLLFNVANEHISPNQPIESKHVSPL
jgi:hypothetical protein